MWFHVCSKTLCNLFRLSLAISTSNFKEAIVVKSLGSMKAIFPLALAEGSIVYEDRVPILKAYIPK